MRLPRCLVSGALCAILSLCALPATAASDGDGAQPLDRIVAVVNDGIILKSELDGDMIRVRERLQSEGRDVPPTSVLRDRVLEELVLEKIQLQRAEQRGISVDDQAVNEALRNMASNYGTDLAGLRERYAKEGMRFDRVRDDVRKQLIVSRLRQRVVASQVQVSEQELDDFMSRLERASDQRAEYHVRHILIGLPSDASTEQVAETRKRAESVIEQLRAGADFGTVATRVSDGPRALEGGDLGWRRSAELPSLFVDALQDLDAGDIAGPLRSPNGFHVLELVDRRGGSEQTVTESHARHILLKDDGENDQPRQELQQLRRRIMAGADFAELAKAYSEDQATAPKGGDLGWFGPGEMTPAFQQVVDSLQPGQVSEPFRSPFGWHLVKLIERRERQDAGEYRRSQARQTLYKRQVEEQTQRWLRKLRDEAYVDIRLDS